MKKRMPHPEAFELVEGGVDSTHAVFSLSGINVSFNNAPNAMQTINIKRKGKRLVNYIRAVDSTEKAIPTPYLSVSGKDTIVGFIIAHKKKQHNFFFQIKNDKAVYTKKTDTIH